MSENDSDLKDRPEVEGKVDKHFPGLSSMINLSTSMLYTCLSECLDHMYRQGENLECLNEEFYLNTEEMSYLFQPRDKIDFTDGTNREAYKKNLNDLINIFRIVRILFDWASVRAQIGVGMITDKLNEKES